MARENFHIYIERALLPRHHHDCHHRHRFSHSYAAAVMHHTHTHTFAVLLEKAGKPIKVTTYYNSNRNNNEASIF